ncbi:MAG: SIMPL domain-containing protein [Cellvibrionaceae bacterium]|nr:SIMPL domain-containing protein [Cellvibrionaceae bacterium]MCV6626343.1 SIMPL domain-containing protein [Cellvibrionaceae bacterium]
MNRLLAFVFLFVATAVHADELNYNLVDLSASAKAEVPNDLMRVSFTVKHQDARADKAANSVNKDMAWAIAQLKGQQHIKYQSGAYNTYPVYKNSRIVAWTASQTLILRSENFDDTAKLVAKLQERLAVGQMTFLAKDSTREAVQEDLIGKAIAAFKRKAGLVQNAMGASGYETVQLSIDQQGHNSPRPYFKQERSLMMSADAVAAPALEAGQSNIEVSVRGQIQLKP